MPPRQAGSMISKQWVKQTGAIFELERCWMRGNLNNRWLFAAMGVVVQRHQYRAWQAGRSTWAIKAEVQSVKPGEASKPRGGIPATLRVGPGESMLLERGGVWGSGFSLDLCGSTAASPLKKIPPGLE